MELKNGYKQTEVGVIPDDWLDCKFEDVLTGFSSGQTPYRGIDRYYTGNIPWITSGELNFNIITDTIEKITKESVVKTNLKIIPRGTFLFAITGLEAAGTRGSCAITGIEATTNQSCMALYPKKELLITEYLYQYYLKYGDWLALQYCQGTKQQSYTGRIAKRLPIVLPPTREEQTAIATALSDTDALISRLEALIAKKRLIKQGAMQGFQSGNKRLLGFSGDWHYKDLPSVCWYQEGPGLRNWQFTNEGIKVINVTNLENGILNLDRTSRYISLDEFTNMYRHFEIDDRDIVVASSGNSYAKVAVVRKQDLPLVMNTSVIRFKPSKDLDYNFLLQFLISNQFKDQIDLLITGGAQPNFGPAHLRKIRIKLPPTIEEQHAIAQTLTDMDTEITGLEQKMAKYKLVKQGMMQELLTGKTRLV